MFREAIVKNRLARHAVARLRMQYEPKITSKSRMHDKADLDQSTSLLPGSHDSTREPTTGM
jgi:hypothetical protein